MPFQQDTFMGSDGETLITYFKMFPETQVRGIVQIVHGMCEYMERYTNLAEYLTDKGYIVCGEDHMGHGRTVGEGGIYGYFGREDGWEHLIDYKQTCPTFASQGDNIFIILNSKQIYYLPQRETMSLSSKDVHYTNIYEKIVPSKSPQCIC